MTRHVIYDPVSGEILAVMTGSEIMVRANVRPGQETLQYNRYVSAATHRVVGGVVTPK